LADENIAALSTLIANLDRASRNLPATMRETDALVRDLRSTVQELGVAATALRETTEATAPGIREIVQRLGVVSGNLASSSTQLDRFMAENAGSASEFTRNGLPEIERLVEESRAAADELRALSRSLRDDPSQLLYPPSPRGVEVPR
jgi:phospholipid/cholesterol/gamma-HCH transport system substrate-binding protein